MTCEIINEGLSPDEVATKERHGEYKQSRPESDLGRAIRRYYLSRTSFSGIMKSNNYYFGYGE